MTVGLPSLPIFTRASVVPFPAYLMHISADANHWPSCDMSKLALQPLQRSRPTYAFVRASFRARSTQPIWCASTPVLLEGSSCMSVKFHTNRFPYESCQYGNSCWREVHRRGVRRALLGSRQSRCWVHLCSCPQTSSPFVTPPAIFDILR